MNVLVPRKAWMLGAADQERRVTSEWRLMINVEFIEHIQQPALITIHQSLVNRMRSGKIKNRDLGIKLHTIICDHLVISLHATHRCFEHGGTGVTE